MGLHNAEQIRATLQQAGTSPEDLVSQYGTPFYLYSAEKIRQQYRTITQAFETVGLQKRVRVHYAVKANDRLGILRIMRGLGAGVDLVSFGEHLRADRAGIAVQEQIFSGVGKTREELLGALQAGVGQINVESLPELRMIEQCARELGVQAPVAFRLNPDTRAGGHENISTGAAEHKFGLAFHDAAQGVALAKASAHLHPMGVAIHIGSQIVDVSLFSQAFGRVKRFLTATRFTPEVIDLGGGFAVNYETEEALFDFPAYAQAVQEAFGEYTANISLEPGRFLVAHAGVVIFQSLLEKQAADVRWLITDMGMNDMMRPALYQARHRLSVLSEVDGERQEYSIAGPVCESTDKLQGSYTLPEMAGGHLLALHDVGAYGSVMSMQYNARRLPPEILVDGNSVTLLRRAINTEDLFFAEENGSSCPTPAHKNSPVR